MRCASTRNTHSYNTRIGIVLECKRTEMHQPFAFHTQFVDTFFVGVVAAIIFAYPMHGDLLRVSTQSHQSETNILANIRSITNYDV